jgi:8-oxo-dGTP pyrophosphatase MutT (NUDIX family)
MKINTEHNPESPTPSATVILLREGKSILQTLLVRRQPGTAPFAGAWVFPGGTIAAADGSIHPGDAWPEAARRAAVRELKEEAGLDVMAHDLVPFSCWTSPTVMPRRFRTWFFLAAAPAGNIRLSREEVSAYCWITPQQALDRHRLESMPLFPPTWVSLHKLRAIGAVAEALDTYARRPPFIFNPRVRTLGASRCFIYEGDVAYNDGDIDRPGPRHRLWAHAHGWRYEQEAETAVPTEGRRPDAG